MRFRKLVLSMLIGVLLGNLFNINAYAAEDITTNQEQGSITAEATTTEVTTTEVTTADVTTSEVAPEEATTAETTPTEATTADVTSTEVTPTEETTTVTTPVTPTTETNTEPSQSKKVVKKSTAKYTKSELRLLSAIIYCEAQGESYNGKLAVGIVIMNRKRSKDFPDTIKSVIYQRYQFSPVTNGTLKKALAEYDKGNFTSTAELSCIKAAKAALNGAKSIVVKGKKKDFSKYLYFSGRLRGYTYKYGNHKFK